MYNYWEMSPVAAKDICLPWMAAVQKVACVPPSAGTITDKLIKLQRTVRHNCRKELMSHHSTQSWWVYQYWQQCLFLCDTFLQDDVHEGVQCTILFPTSTRAEELFKAFKYYISGNQTVCHYIHWWNSFHDWTVLVFGFTIWVKEITSEYESTYTHCQT